MNADADDVGSANREAGLHAEELTSGTSTYSSGGTHTGFGDLPVTEQRNPRSHRLDRMAPDEMLALFDAEDRVAIDAVAAAAEAIAHVAERVAETFQADGRIVLLGAGTSGRIAVQEVAELPPTFGVKPGVFRALIASDVRIADSTVARSEDDTTAVVAALADQDIGTGDVVIGVAASGTTPFVLAGLRYAKAAGAWTAGLACNDGTPLLQEADEPILLATGPEIVAGSTRLKAGTAQKVALNRISTVAMVLSGRVTSNVMTELTGSVDKLRSRAVRIVADLGDVPVDVACRALESTDWRVRPALEFVWSSDSPDSTP